MPCQLPLSRCHWWLNSSPLTHCDNYRPVNLLRLQSQSTHSRAGCQQVAARIDRRSSRPSLNDRKDNMWASSLKISRTRNRILDTEKFSQVSRVSLTSLLFILCLHRHNQPNLNVSLQTLFINKFHIKSVLKKSVKCVKLLDILKNVTYLLTCYL